MPSSRTPLLTSSSPINYDAIEPAPLDTPAPSRANSSDSMDRAVVAHYIRLQPNVRLIEFDDNLSPPEPDQDIIDEEPLLDVAEVDTPETSFVQPDETTFAEMTKTVPRCYTVLGVILAISAGVCFTSCNILQKWVSIGHKPFDYFELLFIRGVVQMIGMFFLIKITPSIEMFGDFGTRFRVAAQGFLGGLMLLCIFIAIANVPIGNASAIFFTSPALTMIFSIFMLKDHCGFLRVLIVGVLLGGIVLLCRPPAFFPASNTSTNTSSNTSTNSSANETSSTSHTIPLQGVVALIAVPVLSAIVTIFTRQCKHVNIYVMALWFGMGSTVVAMGGIAYSYDQKPEYQIFNTMDSLHISIAFLITLIGIAGNIFMILCLKWLSPSRAMVFRSFEVVVNYLFQLYLFDTPFFGTDAGGITMVVVAVLTMGGEKFIVRHLECCRIRGKNLM